MADKRPLMPKVLVAIVVIAAVAYALVRLDVWYTEGQAAKDLPDPPTPGSTETSP